jgi:uncharacterized protein YcbX
MSVNPPPGSMVGILRIPLHIMDDYGEDKFCNMPDEGQIDFSSRNRSLRQIRVCYTQHLALRCTQDADAWFSSILGIQCQLVRCESPFLQSIKNGTCNSIDNNQIISKKSFSNSAPFLLLSRNSFNLLQQKVSFEYIVYTISTTR